MDYIQAMEAFTPLCPQEEEDRTFMLRFAAEHPDCLSRENDIAHFTASAWAVDRERQQLLMVYHNIYRSWSWTGGHADGEADLAALALRELREETGAENIHLVSEIPVSLEILTVDGHEKRGRYVHSHLHLNLTYLIEADPSEPLRIAENENSAVDWLSVEELPEKVTEPWMLERVYSKLINRI